MATVLTSITQPAIRVSLDQRSRFGVASQRAQIIEQILDEPAIPQHADVNDALTGSRSDLGVNRVAYRPIEKYLMHLLDPMERNDDEGAMIGVFFEREPRGVPMRIHVRAR